MNNKSASADLLSQLTPCLQAALV